jgi:hypothetical protein
VDKVQNKESGKGQVFYRDGQQSAGSDVQTAYTLIGFLGYVCICSGKTLKQAMMASIRIFRNSVTNYAAVLSFALYSMRS